MLAEPRRQILIAIVAILVENHDYRSHFAREPVRFAHEDFLAMPVADGLANIDAIENRRRERFDADSLFRQHRLGFFLEESAVLFDDQIFRRIRADRFAVGLASPFAGKFLTLARL